MVRRFLAEYNSGTPSRLKVLDAYLLYVMLTGALQFGYCLGVGTFPFNSFLSGFISAVGSFILGGEALSSPLGEGHCVLRRRGCPHGNPLSSDVAIVTANPRLALHWGLGGSGLVSLCRRGNLQKEAA